MLSLASSALSFSAPALAPRLNQAAVSMKAPGEIGVTPPLGVFDTLGCLNEPIEYPRRSYRRYQELEIKHGFDDEPTRPHKIQRHFYLRFLTPSIKLSGRGPLSVVMHS